MTEPKPVILLNIAETVPVLEGLNLYAIEAGNTDAKKMDDHESCFRFYVTATNTKTGERTKERFALHGRLQSRKGVGIDHKFVVDKIVTTVKEYLAKSDMMITDDLPMGPTMTQAIWRHTFGSGYRVADFANGVGVFAQPIETNFQILDGDIEALDAMDGNFTLAVASDSLVKFYLGEEPPVWGYKHEERTAWRPHKKKVTPGIISACLEHFVEHADPGHKELQAFPSDRFEDLKSYVLSKRAVKEDVIDAAPEPVQVEQQPVDLSAPEKPGLLKRLASTIGMGAAQG
jgi:hypothetical protein